MRRRRRRRSEGVGGASEAAEAAEKAEAAEAAEARRRRVGGASAAWSSRAAARWVLAAARELAGVVAAEDEEVQLQQVVQQ